MGALLGRIAREIGDRVEGAVALHELFHMAAADAAGLLRTSKALLEAWHATYMQVGGAAGRPFPDVFVLGRKTAAVSRKPPKHCKPHSARHQVREKIELSGRDARWEFPKGPLFGRTNYMADVCGALCEMVELVDDFFKFLGPELKAVTGGLASALPVCRGTRAEHLEASSLATQHAVCATSASNAFFAHPQYTCQGTPRASTTSSSASS